MIDVNVQQLGMEAGGAAIIGGLIGFAFKRIAKLIAIIIGIELAIFRFLEARGIVTVDWERLTSGAISGTDQTTQAPPDWVWTILSTLSISAGFTIGFLIGYKQG
ncbi:FUN14 domain-containing protein [Natronocalculus amylovorans]|uniref:FUN14 domain-containing protein n=1 Tax=Natronocalculus amylovorans TaxID=2917812 RepID=A0AAE3FXR1_9EURY|nr:FUN14 domain-containing protein [Natronocalculus amylovorans]MCL9817146.1 FUN14 domain-containing protein [Natronocalculus amylovorans]